MKSFDTRTTRVPLSAPVFVGYVPASIWFMLNFDIYRLINKKLTQTQLAAL